MLVKDIMSGQVECVLADGTLREAAEKMNERGVGALPVVAHGKPVGIVTDRDVALALGAGREPTAPVEAVMTPEPTWCGEQDDVEEAARVMAAKRIRRLLVRDGKGRLRGILSLGDLAGERASQELAGRVLASVCSAS